MTTPASVENPHAGQGSVLLDIGGDVGALVVTMPADMVDLEVEIRPSGQAEGGHHHHPHVAVLERPVGNVLIPSLVFAELLEGSYELYLKDTHQVRLTVDIVGGEVSSATWPA